MLYEDQCVLTNAYKRCGRFDYSQSKRKTAIQASVDKLTKEGYLRSGTPDNAYLLAKAILFVEEGMLLKNHTARFQHFRARYDELEAQATGPAAIAELDAVLVDEGYSPDEVRGLKQLRAILLKG
jgi:hypothetical protein